MVAFVMGAVVASALVWGAVSSAAIADEPIKLTDAQMDIVTAGQVGTTLIVVATASAAPVAPVAPVAAGATPAPVAGQVVEASAAVAAPARRRRPRRQRGARRLGLGRTWRRRGTWRTWRHRRCHGSRGASQSAFVRRDLQCFVRSPVDQADDLLGI